MRKKFDKHVRPIMKSTGLGDFTIDPKTKDAKKLAEAKKFVNDLIKNEVRSLIYAWNLVPEELWENYKMFNLNDLPECRILKQAKKEFTAKWRQRPGAIRRTYND